MVDAHEGEKGQNCGLGKETVSVDYGGLGVFFQTEDSGGPLLENRRVLLLF